MHISVPLPDRISATDARRIAAGLEKVVNRHTGALVEAVITDLEPLTDQERRAIVALVDVAMAAETVTVSLSGGLPFNGGQLATIHDLRSRLNPDGRPALVAETLREYAGDHGRLSRPQELAADALQAEYGARRVRHLADGAVVITGMTGDVERTSVCVERDGRERWRQLR